MFTEQDAYDAIIKLAKLKGNIRAALIERMFREETAHFTSGQYVKTGSAGMERGAWPNIPNNVSYVKMRDNKDKRLVDFIVWNNVYDFVLYLSDYIDRNGGNFARWNSTNPSRQRNYASRVNQIKNRWIKGDNPYLNSNYIPSQRGTTETMRPPDDKTIICKSNQTLAEFIEEHSILMTPQELLKYSLNSERIYKSYNQQEKVQYKKASIELIVTGTRVIVPMYQIAAPKSIYTINQTIIENKKYTAFVEKEVRKLLFNPDYKKINNVGEDLNGSKEYGSLYKKMNNISVWVWAKSIDYDKGSKLIDITPFIIDINTNVGENGGNFTLTLPHLTFTPQKDGNINIPVNWMYDEKFESFISKNTLHSIKDFNMSDIKCNFIDDNDELKGNGQILVRNMSYFNTILQKNDMVFIRYERLKLDKTYGNYQSNVFNEIPSSDIPENVFDMIGLIDTVANSANPEQTEQTITIQGRDLSKLLLDDSIYNFIVGYGVKDKEQILQNSNKNKSTGRVTMTVGEQEFNVGSGIAQDNVFNFFQTHSIDEWITFIFSQLTNSVVVPDSLFNSYKDRSFITSRQNTHNAENDFTYKKTLASGIWQIVKLCFDNETTKRRLADDSLSTNTGSLMNMVRKYAQMPFIQMNMDTYGDKFYFMFRKPPFTYESFKTNPCINIFDGDVTSENLDFDGEFYSMFQLDALGSLIESTDGQNLLVQPAVLFPEFMRFFGLRNLHVASNYLDFDASVSNLTQTNLDHLTTQLNNDMDWLINAHLYLPFTRKGSITIKGDRRIKRGMNIRYFPTGEVFYVDNVSNYASFSESSNERATTVQISRGMVEKDLEKYFNLTKTTKGEDGKKKWDTNIENFKYLIERRQFR